MQVYTVTLRETRLRRIQMVADSAGAAEIAAADVLPEGAKVVEIQLYTERQPAAAKKALHYLLSRDFMTLPSGPTGTVGDWVHHAANGEDWAMDRLPLIGLRVENDRLLIGSPTSVPALAAWFKGTHWAKAELLAALALVDGAKRTNRTMAGVKTRAVSLPLEPVLDMIGGAE